jgi:hypothetical protein
MSPSLQMTLQDDIALALRTTGTYTGEIDPPNMQRSVDAQWAARVAARAVGVKVNVSVINRPGEHGPSRMILRVTAVR